MLCGATPNCGCSMSTAAATAGGLSGTFPTITVTGTGAPATPWSMALNTSWASNAVALVVHAGAQTWGNVPFTSPWANYGGGWAPAQYRLLGDIVQLRGLVARSPTASGTTMFVLPATHRPPAYTQFNTDHQDRAHGAITVDTSGNVQFHYITGDAAYVSLSHVYFSITP